MFLLPRLAGALVACAVAVSAARAEGTLSASNGGGAPGAALAALLGAERNAMAAMPQDALKVTRKTRQKKDAAPAIEYSAEWLFAQDAPQGGAQWECLARAIYHESRGEILPGQFAVAEVILNRVDSGRYPATICAVVGQSGSGGCQFSYVCDGRSDAIGDRAAWAVAARIAAVMMAGAPRTLTGGATHFHTTAVRPAWSAAFPRTAVIGAHLFYRQPGAVAAPAPAAPVTVSAMN
jgi:spore germination cell wall hydrolase CwlJ-like protein